MKRKALFAAAAFALLSAAAEARAQYVAPAAAPAPQAAAAPAAPVAPQEPADAPEPAIGFASSFFDEGNYLGVRVEDVTRENMAAYGLSGEPRGVGIKQVLKGSPAERAGLRERDVIVRFDGESVTSVLKLNRLIAESAAGHSARVAVLRGGSEQELSATLARRERLGPALAGAFGVGDLADARRLGEGFGKNAEEWELKGGELGRRLEEMQLDGLFASASSRRIGVTTSPLGKQLAGYFGVTQGVLINSVEQGSPADKAGLKAGDVVTEVDGKQVADAGDLSRALGAKDEGEVTLTVVRDKNRRTVRVTPERRSAPRGLFVNPGAVRVVPPAVSAAPRVMTIPSTPVAPVIIRAPYSRNDPDFITPPLILSVPHILSTPSVIAAPRVLSTPRVFAAPRVTPRVRVAPRVTIVSPVERIL